MTDLKKTSLYNKHIELNAKMLPFAGYQMPINYPLGIQKEYDFVRNSVGMFDVSHMGQIKIFGKESKNLIEKITVNNVDNLQDGDAQYSAICNISGGIIDDIILYKLKRDEFLLVVNGANREKVYNWIVKNNNYDCSLFDQTLNHSLIAIQGPDSRNKLEQILKEKISLKFYTHKYCEINSVEFLLSRTGYTGELGFELLGDINIINKIWDEFIDSGVHPCGLAVRDVLRMEMKYCLYGNDINEDLNPIEAGLSWIVNNNKNFIGKESIELVKKNGPEKKLRCIKMIDRCIPRTGYDIMSNELVVGKVTSGTFSNSLKAGIALAYISSNVNISDTIYLEIRGKKYRGQIVSPPFITNTSLHN